MARLRASGLRRIVGRLRRPRPVRVLLAAVLLELFGLLATAPVALRLTQ